MRLWRLTIISFASVVTMVWLSMSPAPSAPGQYSYRPAAEEYDPALALYLAMTCAEIAFQWVVPGPMTSRRVVSDAP
jgi:hypothetical protein